MAQVTIYLDEETKAKLEQAAKSAKVPVSRWLAELIRERTRDQWPDHVAEMAGSWGEMPSSEELRADDGEDVHREKL